MVTHRCIRLTLLGLTYACLLMLALGHPEPARAQSTIQIRDLAFAPLTTTINPGDTVVWANVEDLMPHNVASGQAGGADAGLLFESPYIMPGDGFSYTFTEAGEYPYYCPLHPTMIGVIKVAPAS
jgi:plastocyanin